MPVTIDRFRAEKNLQVAQQVADDKKEKRTARDGHDVFFSQRGGERSLNQIHSQSSTCAAPSGTERNLTTAGQRRQRTAKNISGASAALIGSNPRGRSIGFF